MNKPRLTINVARGFFHIGGFMMVLMENNEREQVATETKEIRAALHFMQQTRKWWHQEKKIPWDEL